MQSYSYLTVDLFFNIMSWHENAALKIPFLNTPLCWKFPTCKNKDHMIAGHQEGIRMKPKVRESFLWNSMKKPSTNPYFEKKMCLERLYFTIILNILISVNCEPFFCSFFFTTLTHHVDGAYKLCTVNLGTFLSFSISFSKV